MTVTDPWAEWKDGYRDGLTAGVKVAEVCAQEPGATALDVLILLQTLSESSVIQPDPGGFTHHVETPASMPAPGQALHAQCGHPDWPDCPHYR